MIGASWQALAVLAERSAGDVRCCLNTLQFLSRRRRTVKSGDVAGVCAGHKDVQQGAFAVWEQLLWTRVSACCCACRFGCSCGCSF